MMTAVSDTLLHAWAALSAELEKGGADDRRRDGRQSREAQAFLQEDHPDDDGKDDARLA